MAQVSAVSVGQRHMPDADSHLVNSRLQGFECFLHKQFSSRFGRRTRVSNAGLKGFQYSVRCAVHDELHILAEPFLFKAALVPLKVPRRLSASPKTITDAGASKRLVDFATHGRWSEGYTAVPLCR